MSVRLDANDVGKRFGRRVLFRGLSISVRGGDSLAVIGANGAGKSTLLRIFAGVLTPTKGRVELHVDEVRISPDQHPLRVGLVAPYMNVYDGFSPRENLRFIARARRIPDAERRMEELLDSVELTDRADDPVATFSSGMKQRVKFAVALLAAPPVLLLDEPLVNLDAAGFEMVLRVIAQQQERGGILIVATNDPNEAARHTRRLRIEDHR